MVPAGSADAGGGGGPGVWSVAVDSSEVSRWFGEYLDAFATYLVTDGAAGRRISVLAVRSP